MTTHKDVRIPLGDTGVPAALALPESDGGPWPAVVVIHEITGLNDDIRRIARRFADAGYVALAPALFAGLGPPAHLHRQDDSRLPPGRWESS
ncbi:MAG TPA: dienelactone hydrolase family protein [Dehalococcoidia bacterium]